MCHARKERVLLFGTDQRITSGPAARTAAFRGRIHGCTRTIRGTVRFFSLAPRAPSIHGTKRTCCRQQTMTADQPKAELSAPAPPEVYPLPCDRLSASRRLLHGI